MKELLALAERSIIAQAMITAVVVTAFAISAVRDRSVPQELASLTWVIIGFYFGAKVENMKRRQ
jgi:hypothetical protein